MIAAAFLSLLMLQTADSVITQIGIDQKLGSTIPLEIPFRDETGTVVALDRFCGSTPVIMIPGYYECPMLCSMQLNGLVRAMKVLPFTAGKEFEIVTFSIDPHESPDLARAKKEHYVRDYGRRDAAEGWHFLTGDQEAIAKLTDAIGFRYTYDKATGQWAHVSALIVLTPSGHIAQYFNGIEHDPQDLKFSLIQSSGERIGSVIDRALLYCYQYDANTGKYSLTVMRVVRLAGVATVLGLLGFMAVSWKGKPKSAHDAMSS